MFLVKGFDNNNITFKTLSNYFTGPSKYETLDRIAFSSARKWSAIELDSIGTIIVGAPATCPDYQRLSPRIIEIQKAAHVFY